VICRGYTVQRYGPKVMSHRPVLQNGFGSLAEKGGVITLVPYLGMPDGTQTTRLSGCADGLPIQLAGCHLQLVAISLRLSENHQNREFTHS
jgi:hypothetical protein